MLHTAIAIFLLVALTLSPLQEDVDFMVQAMESRHPNLFARVDRETFEAAAADFRAQIPSLTPEQVITGFMKLAALPRDGHTSMFPFPLDTRVFPFHLYVFSDGVFIVNARPPYTGLIGRQIVIIGGRDVDDVMRAVMPTLAADNPMTALSILPVFLTSAMVLQGTGMIGDQSQATFTLRNNGADIEVAIQSVKLQDALDFIQDPNLL